jgi:hypothetical protein
MRSRIHIRKNPDYQGKREGFLKKWWTDIQPGDRKNLACEPWLRPLGEKGNKPNQK